MIKVRDALLVHIEDKPSFFARIEKISPDVKPGWLSVVLLVFQVPVKTITWIVQTAQLNGKEFTMGGTKIRIEKVTYSNDSSLNKEKGEPKSFEEKLVSPVELKTKLDQLVFGHEAAKVKLAVAVHNHLKCLGLITKGHSKSYTKSNILLIGPTGTGKTFMVKNLAKLVQLPFVAVDATKLLHVSYSGKENFLLKLFETADFNIEQAEKSIVYIDHIDKIAYPLKGDSTKKDIQAFLLEILEGTTVAAPLWTGPNVPNYGELQIDTSNILFICAGAFNELDMVIKSRLSSFTEDYYQKLIPDDLIKYGFQPEFVGRIPIIITLTKLSESDLFNILLKNQNTLLEEYKKIFEIDNVTLEFTEAAIKAVAREAHNRNTGFRGVKAILNNLALNIAYDIALDPGIKKIVISEDIINTHSKS